jgi:NAD(P)-dependent dehydrogenase (short-subunit alcohol dehydrogenase family)
MRDNEMRKVALITGGTRGIGLGISRCLAREGFDLAVNGVRPADAVADVLAELRGLGARVEYVQADVGEAADRDKLLAEVRRHFGRLDVLVNNAGVAPETREDILKASPESFRRVMRINVEGPYFLTQAVANWMIQQRQANAGFAGCIVNISSVSATAASIHRGEYCISKAGVAMASQLWAARLAEYGIGVYEVRPGLIETDMTAAVKHKYDELIAGGLVPQGRWGQGEDVGKAVAAIARGDLAYSTGSVIHVDGGLHVQRL